MNPRGRRGGWAALVAVLLAVTAPTARAQDLTCGAGDVEVMKLSFEGNRAFPSAVLAGGIVTAPSNWWMRTVRWPPFLGTRRCLDKEAFPLDRLRLMIWYRNHGYASVAVDTVVTPAGAGKIAVRFVIHEGEPTIVDSLQFTGLDSVPERTALLKGLPTQQGHPFDKYANDTTRDVLTQRLHNGGYPDAEVLINSDTRPGARRASVTFAVDAGPRMRLGEIVLKVEPRPGASRKVKDAAVRHVASLSTGELYSQAELERAKRSLYQTDA
jgi:outer membrane protein assembly factor BamA